eukprot:1910059-Ditylum_brightwellii.AAC.1
MIPLIHGLFTDCCKDKTSTLVKETYEGDNESTQTNVNNITNITETTCGDNKQSKEEQKTMWLQRKRKYMWWTTAVIKQLWAKNSQF